MSTRVAGTQPRSKVRAETVARAALALVGSGGLESLTMRKLATSLGVQLPTLYRLFENKQALLDEMAETITAGVSERVRFDGADWAENVTVFAREMRESLLAQRDGARIVGGSYVTKQHTMTLGDRTLAMLDAAGFPEETALWTLTTIFSYVLGETLEQQGASGTEAETFTAALDPTAYPRLSIATIGRFLDFDGRFEFGLRVLVTGLRAELGGGAQSIPSGSGSG
ncbi:TetR/AcrR family transcriptional regulator C-terminal domain-containing protein [Amycolatopsis sp. NPDC059027]|uniref:TetR/AcrR family transcriptional regulator C-terminal domain-containing protein n=1 Tax=unclassified Amycolatopsis TaxID=2618356 RepID=UPI00366B3BF0